MNSQEKAKKLVNEYYQLVADSSAPDYLSKQCALRAVNEIIVDYEEDPRYDYWLQVKQEIKKL